MAAIRKQKKTFIICFCFRSWLWLALKEWTERSFNIELEFLLDCKKTIFGELFVFKSLFGWETLSFVDCENLRLFYEFLGISNSKMDNIGIS